MRKRDEDDKPLLEQERTQIEIENALKQMKNSKSSGIDGLTTEFLKHFWADIKKLLYNAYWEWIKKRCLSPIMKTFL